MPADENLPLRSSEGCSAGLDFQAIFHENDDKIVSVPVCSDHSKNAHVAVCMGEGSDHNAGCSEHSWQTCLTLERASYLQVASDCGRHTPTLGQCPPVCGLRTADQLAFYTRQSLLHATALPIDGLDLETELHVDSFHGEIRAESL